MVRKVKPSTTAKRPSKAVRRQAPLKSRAAPKRISTKKSDKFIKNKRDFAIQAIVIASILLVVYLIFSWLDADDPVLMPPVSTAGETASAPLMEEVVDPAVMDAINERLKIEEANKAAPLDSARPQAWQINAAYADLPNGVPRLVIIIDDLGYLPDASKRFADMEGPLTLSFLPYGTNLASQTGYVLLRGHELIVHMPMAPKADDADPGPNALLTGLDEKEFKTRLEHNLSRFTGYVGVNNHMGSLLTERSREMTWVMEALAERGLLFLDSVTTPNSIGQKTAQSLGVPVMRRDVFIDNNRTEAEIFAQLDEAKELAMRRGVAVAIGHPYPETLDALEKWLPRLNSSEIVLAPLSAVMQEKYQN